MNELKIYAQLCVITLKNDEKSEEELGRWFKIDIRNVTNFDSRTRKYQKFTHYSAVFDQILCLSLKKST